MSSVTVTGNGGSDREPVANLSNNLDKNVATNVTTNVTTRTPADNQQRIDALNPMRSICVTAPAGSGKTELLSQRVLTLLARVSQPEEILAITFTRKAAAEMHSRIIEALRVAKTSPEPSQPHELLRWQLARKALAQDKLCNWQLLTNPNRLKIQTIDSLCSLLTRQMPVLSNFGAQPKITEQAESYYVFAVHNLLGSLETDSVYAADLMNLLSHVDNDMQKVERLLVALLRKRDQWLFHIGLGQSADQARILLESTLNDLITETLNRLNKYLLPLSPELLPLMDYAGCNLQWEKSTSPISQLAGVIELPGIKADFVPMWLGVAELLLTKTGTWRKSINKNAGFPTETQDGDKVLAKELKNKLLGFLAECKDRDDLLELLIDLRYLPKSSYPDNQWQLLESLTRLLPVLVAQLRLVFQRDGIVDFIEVSMAASNALGDGLNPTDIAMKLDYQLKHILIDEFQDTSSTQFKLLYRLLEGWSEHNVVNPQNPNTLFIVGDGMQSIYGFREANVGLFMEAKQTGINGINLDDLRLSVNFRSDPEVIDWVNKTFKKAFPSSENLSRGAVPYEISTAFKSSQSESSVDVLGFIGENARVREAEQVVKLIEDVLKDNADASIAVLIRSRSSLRDIIPELTRAHIPWGAKDINPLANYSTIADLLILTKAMLNIADKVSWTALLRTPWIGLGNADIYTLLGGSRKNQPVISSIQNNTVIEQLSVSGAEKLDRAAKIILLAYQNRQRLSVRSWIEGVWLELGGASVVNGLDEFSFVDDYFDLLESYQQGESNVQIGDFEQAMSSLYAKPLNEDANIQIMTIHKAKGLEFDVVILPGLARPSRSDDKSLLMWREYISKRPNTIGSSGLIISPLGSGAAEDSVYNHLRFEQSLSSRLEDTRLLYVAATRAIRKLYIMFTTDVDPKAGLPKPPVNNSLLARAWGTIEAEAVWDSNISSSKGQIGLDFVNDNKLSVLKRIETQWRPPVMKTINPLGDYYIDNEQLNNIDNIPELNMDPLPRCVGLTTHAILERLARNSDQNTEDSSKSLWFELEESHRNRWIETLLHFHGLNSSYWEKAIPQIIQNIDNILSDSKGQWILFGDHQQSFSELKLTSCTDTGVKNRIIDRCIVDSKSDCWIIDYKTSHPKVGEVQEDFVNRESAHYSGQLEAYRRIITGHADFPRFNRIRLALYFTALPLWLEL